MSTKLYNESKKKEFLDTLDSEMLQYVVESLLQRVGNIEKALGKDLHDMDLNELGETMKGLAVSSELSAYHSLLHMERYVSWAVVNGYRSSNITPFDLIDKAEWSKQFVVKYKRTMLTREQLLNMTDELVNRVDRAIMMLLFEGISGKGYSEIINLKMSDIEETDEGIFLRVKDGEGTERIASISEELRDMLWFANNEGVYISGNNFNLSTVAKTSVSKYADSDNIFKKSRRGSQKDGLDDFYIHRKFVLFKKVFDSKFLTPKQLTYSGMMHMANELVQRDGEFKAEHYDEIGEQFGVALINQKGHISRNRTIIKRAIEAPEFKEIYGYEAKLGNLHKS